VTDEPQDDRPWDAGLQPERTTLAWVRTSLAFAVVSLLTARLAEEAGVVAVVVSLSGIVVAAALVGLQARSHHVRDRGARTGSTQPATSAVVGAAALTVAFAVAALALLVLAALG
jgi:putative membrane protein